MRQVKAIMLFRNMSSLTESKRFSNLTGSDLNFICRDPHSMFPWTHNSMGFFLVFSGHQSHGQGVLSLLVAYDFNQIASYCCGETPFY